MQDGSLIPRFGRARRDRSLAVLEGFHALKHALRFDADVLEACSDDVQALSDLCARLAPDLVPRLAELVRQVDRVVFERLAPLAPATGVVALAARPVLDIPATLADRRPAPVVLLEDPRDLGNMGACVRVAAAAEAAAVLSIGGHDPWHADALRGAAGLHFALPVAQLARHDDALGADRPLVALDPDGEPLRAACMDPRSLLAFGSERRGLSPALLEAADARVRIPMRAGVSSLNLATSVSAVLFGMRIACEAGGGPPGSASP